MDRDKLLQRLHSPETQHCSLSSSEWKVAVFRPVVLPPAHFPAIEIAQFAHCRWVGPQPVHYDLFNLAVTLQCLLDERQSRRFVPFLRGTVSNFVCGWA